MEKNYHYR